jgi:hypothetical protein
MGQVVRELRWFKPGKAAAEHEPLECSRRIYLIRRCACTVGLQTPNRPVGLTVLCVLGRAINRLQNTSTRGERACNELPGRCRKYRLKAMPIG